MIHLLRPRLCEEVLAMKQRISNMTEIGTSIPEKSYERILIDIIQESPMRILEVPGVWELLGIAFGEEIYERYLDEIRSEAGYKHLRIDPGRTVIDGTCPACRSGSLIRTGNKEGYITRCDNPACNYGGITKYRLDGQISSNKQRRDGE